MNDIQKGYMAGIIDGEGCVYVNRRKAHGRRKTPGYSVKVVVSITNCDIVEWFKKHAKLTSANYVIRKGNRKNIWLCTWNNSKAEELLDQLVPHLIIKRKQAKLGLELLHHLRTTPIKRGVCITDDVLEYRENIKQQISKLNFRGKLLDA